MASLYERIGGEGAVFATAALLYDKVLSDPLLAPFFAGLDTDALVRKQVAFLAWAFGADTRYEYRPLGEAHRDLVQRAGLSDVHFDAVAGHLEASLVELGVGRPLIEEVMALIETVRGTVLGG